MISPWLFEPFFADKLASIVAGQSWFKYPSPCFDLEKRVKTFLDQLEYYSRSTDQPINTNKTEALFSGHAIGFSWYDIYLNYGTRNQAKLVSEYKYLGYLILRKLGQDKYKGEIADFNDLKSFRSLLDQLDHLDHESH